MNSKVCARCVIVWIVFLDERNKYAQKFAGFNTAAPPSVSFVEYWNWTRLLPRQQQQPFGYAEFTNFLNSKLSRRTLEAPQ